MTQEAILEIDNLSVSFMTRLTDVPAVMDFSMSIHKGDAMGLVGESGCGKSTVALAIMQYLGGNGKIVGGTIKYRGRDMATMSEKELEKLRGSEIAMIYQEPMASLNPSMRIAKQLMEVPMLHEKTIDFDKRPPNKRIIRETGIDYFDRYREVFNEVKIYKPDSFDQRFNLTIDMEDISDSTQEKHNYQLPNLLPVCLA